MSAFARRLARLACIQWGYAYLTDATAAASWRPDAVLIDDAQAMATVLTDEGHENPDETLLARLQNGFKSPHVHKLLADTVQCRRANQLDVLTQAVLLTALADMSHEADPNCAAHERQLRALTREYTTLAGGFFDRAELAIVNAVLDDARTRLCRPEPQPKPKPTPDSDSAGARASSATVTTSSTSSTTTNNEHSDKAL